MAIKKSVGSKTFDVCNYGFMILLMFVMIYPFWHVIMASLSNSNILSMHMGPLFSPAGFSLQAYDTVIHDHLIWSGYANTLFVVIMGTLLNVLMTSLGAYVTSRKHFAIRKPLTVFIMFTMYFSGGLIPSYLLVNNTLNLSNSLWSLILPGLISTWNLLIMRTAFFNVPDSIEESAKLDGANDFIVLFGIILPTIMATVAVIILFYAVGHWNAWFSAMLYLHNKAKWPLQLVLREIIILSNVQDLMNNNDPDAQSISETIKYATIIVSTVPILCVYPFLQRYFVKGVMIGAVKG